MLCFFRKLVTKINHFKAFNLYFLFTIPSVFALEGIDGLTQNLYDQNLEIKSLENTISAKKALQKSSQSNFYPTLNLVTGYNKNKLNETTLNDSGLHNSGIVTYFEGKLNLYNGGRNNYLSLQKEIDIRLSKTELEIKKRDLKNELIKNLSEMITIHRLQSILEEEIKENNLQKKMAFKKVESGLTGKVDQFEFELRENELEIEKKQLIQKHVEIHQNLFSIYGREFEDSSIDRIKFTPIEELKSIEHLHPEINLEVQKTELIQLKNTLERKEITSEFLPTLDLIYAAGKVTPNNPIFSRLNEYKGSLLLTIPLFSGLSTYYNLHASKENQLSLEKNTFQNKVNTFSKSTILKSKIDEIASLYEINERKIELSKKYFELTMAEYKKGIKNSPDVVNATQLMFTSQKKKLEYLNSLETLKITLNTIGASNL